ncbi:unnamed protein product [Triticum turgidum subsp. durum]|uniref:Uncharacterized protein n=1 Tax=Triticum turgidum subsp. durum TaxID=4567 RepID=A0A9R0XPT5_TRITD|nr:unnamed protein product [Triticum turgidum subsp. durum]
MAYLHPTDPSLPLGSTVTQATPTHPIPIPTDVPEISIGLHGAVMEDEGMRKKQARDKAWGHYSNLQVKMHRFPPSLWEFCQGRSFIVPKMVAIGPYHRHLPELQAMEAVKKTAPLFFCQGAPMKAYEDRVAFVADAARSCYDAESLEGLSDTAFASMMFHDACFLLATMLAMTVPEEACNLPFLCLAAGNAPVVVTDMFLLENQIPWVVLKALMRLRNMGLPDLSAFLAMMGMNVQSRIDREARPLEIGEYDPPHLLGLFRFYQSGNVRGRQPEKQLAQEALLELDVLDMTGGWLSGKIDTGGPATTTTGRRTRIIARADAGKPTGAAPATMTLERLPLGTSAIELAEIGVKLTLSKTSEFTDIGVTEGPLFRKIFLPSLRLNENTACWLLNMAAFETITALLDRDYIVSSYLALFAMFMDREEDVHELRAKRLIHGEFTDKQTLDFFKGRHAGNLHAGDDFYRILRRLERYKQRWWMWIAIHRFVYNNVKIIIAVLSIIGVLVGIFKTILPLKQH